MASLPEFLSHNHHHLHHRHHNQNHNHHTNKVTKPRGKMVVKPILRKLASSSSPKNSLDLDRGWEDQNLEFGSVYESGRTSMSPSVRDVNFQFPPWEPTGYGSGGGSGRASGTATPVGGMEPTSAARSIPATTRGRFQHARSTSGTSHVSIGTNGSSHRPGGYFVHPFQQTPRTNTPPLAYANSFTSLERESNTRDYSPTIITENEDDDDHDDHDQTSTSLPHSMSSHLHKPPPSNSHSTASLRRPSLASQRTSSLSDIQSNANSPPLRVNTTPFSRSQPNASPRLTHGASLSKTYSHSDLQLITSPADSPRPSMTFGSTSTSIAPMSPLRNSLDGAFRLRSRSHVDAGARREDIREARRKFEEKERMKQEKYESEQRRKRERKDSSNTRKNTGGSEMTSIGRPSFSRKRTPTSLSIPGSRQAKRSGELARQGTMSEKVQGPGFISSNYESTAGGTTPSFGPDVNDVRFETPKRVNTAKRRTQSYWTSFMLWLRTRLLKLGRR